MTDRRAQPPKDYIFALALVLVLCGTALLFQTTGTLTGVSAFLPMGVAAAGCVILYFGATRRLAAPGLFTGTALVLSGALLLVRGVLQWPITDYWPFFMIITGLSIIVPGYRRYRRPRSAYLIPALSFILLGSSFLLFSFNVIRFTFRKFFSEWWPTLFIAAGFVLLALYFYNRTRFSRSPGRSKP